MSGHLVAMPGGDVAAVHLEDDELLALGLDPWANRGWARDDLRALAASVDEGRRRAREVAERSVLATTRKSVVEPWMEPLVVRQLEADARHVALSKIAALVGDAVSRGVTLVFDID